MSNWDGPEEVISQDKEWVIQAKRNLTALYENQPLERMPFEWAVYNAADEFKSKPVKEEIPTLQELGTEEIRHKFFNMEFELQVQLKNIAKRVREGFWDDKILSLHPIGPVNCWLGEIFGTKIRWFVNRPCFSEPVIKDAWQIDSLRPDFSRGELYKFALEEMRFFREVVGDRIPVTPPDLQSPLDVASMVMDYESLVYAMMDEPARVHALLRMITDTIINTCRAFKKEMITDYPMTQFEWWMPRGIFISDDLMAVLNPDLYREFGVPYNEILADEFGGIGLHSCGCILHNLENVAQTKGILVLNTHDCLCDVAPVVKNHLTVIIGGIFEVIAPNYPGGKRSLINSPEALEEFWWDDAGRIAEIKEQRFLYQHHALLHIHTATEAYERILMLSQKAAENLRQ